MDMNLLKSKMALKGDTQTDLASELNITIQSLSCKFNGKWPFKLSEINAISKKYDLTPEEMQQIFF